MCGTYVIEANALASAPVTKMHTTHTFLFRKGLNYSAEKTRRASLEIYTSFFFHVVAPSREHEKVDNFPPFQAGRHLKRPKFPLSKIREKFSISAPKVVPFGDRTGGVRGYLYTFTFPYPAMHPPVVVAHSYLPLGK